LEIADGRQKVPLLRIKADSVQEKEFFAEGAPRTAKNIFLNAMRTKAEN
jgi:hypothetical protein